MQVSVETTGALERRMTVQVPAERIDQEVENRLKSIARSARLDGFRPGKVPMRVVRQRFGRRVHEEVAQDVMSSTFQEALMQENLRPAGGPRLEPLKLAPGEALEYVATFEIYPELEPQGLEGERVQRPVAEVTDEDVEQMLDKLRRQRANWEAVERPAAEGDMVNIDFEGTIEGEPFEGNRGKGVDLELGSGRLIEGFEAGVVGMSAGESRTLELQFPADYHKAELAGRPVRFEVRLNRVSEQRLPPLDEDFARLLGIEEGGVEALRAEVRQNMERELRQRMRSVLKRRTFDRLLEKNAVEVPQALVQEEAERLAREATEAAGGNRGVTLPTSLFEDNARRRVALGLLIGEIVKRNGIEVDEERLRNLIEEMAATYENPEEVVKWYYENPEALGSARSLVLEDQVVDWALAQAQVEDERLTFDALIEADKAVKE